MFRKVAFLEISTSPLLTGVAGLQYSVCNATKNKLLTKFLKCVLKLTENFQQVISTKGPYQELKRPANYRFYVFLKLLK